MKKMMVVATLVMAVISSQAGLINWNNQLSIMGNDGVGNGLPGAPLTGDVGMGAGWAYDIVNLTLDTTIQGSNPAGAVSFGWFDSNGGYLIAGFNFEAEEGELVALQLYNADNSWSIVSQALLLPTVGLTPPPGSTDLSFDYTGQDWVVIPEPATLGMMAVAGLGLFLSRKKARR